jgi:hypothetical protein
MDKISMTLRADFNVTGNRMGIDDATPAGGYQKPEIC